MRSVARPGVYSARYAGEGASDEANLAKLLDALERRAAGAAHGALSLRDRVRRALRRCAAADRRGHAGKAQIIAARRGTGGFGYDPSFVPRGESRTAAEMPDEEKHLHSHRGQALRAFLDQFRQRGQA